MLGPVMHNYREAGSRARPRRRGYLVGFWVRLGGSMSFSLYLHDRPLVPQRPPPVARLASCCSTAIVETGQSASSVSAVAYIGHCWVILFLYIIFKDSPLREEDVCSCCTLASSQDASSVEEYCFCNEGRRGPLVTRWNVNMHVKSQLRRVKLLIRLKLLISLRAFI